MPDWTDDDLNQVEPILRTIERDLSPLPGKDVLVLCCGSGQMAVRLGKKMGGTGKVVGLDLSKELLERAREDVKAEKLEGIVHFQEAERHRIPFPDESFDALVSEFIVYPAPSITEIGQPEMVRVLKPGGKILLTDVILTKPLDGEQEALLKSISLDYLCEATPDDFREWMEGAGIRNITTSDLTPILEGIWRRKKDASPEHRLAYSVFLDDPIIGLGKTIFYLYIRGEK